MSENGPREGTRDLPRRNPEAGYRGVDENSEAGAAYRRLAQSLRRRRDELRTLAAAGGTATSIVSAYETRHPLEPAVSPKEVQLALKEARAGSQARRE